MYIPAPAATQPMTGVGSAAPNGGRLTTPVALEFGRS
jgi:hypothetical protein